MSLSRRAFVRALSAVPVLGLVVNTETARARVDTEPQAIELVHSEVERLRDPALVSDVVELHDVIEFTYRELPPAPRRAAPHAPLLFQSERELTLVLSHYQYHAASHALRAYRFKFDRNRVCIACGLVVATRGHMPAPPDLGRTEITIRLSEPPLFAER